MLTSNALTPLAGSIFASLDPVGRALAPALLSYALRSTVVLLAAWMVALALRRSAAATRHAVWAIAVATVAVLPLLSRATPPIDLPVHTLPSIPPSVSPAPVYPVRAASAPTSAGTTAAVASAGSPVTAPVRVGQSPRHLEPVPAPLDLTLLIVALWLAGAACLIMRSVIGTVVVWRRAVAAEPVNDAAWIMLARDVARDLKIRRPVTLLMTSVPTIPVTWGIIYPIVLLPIEAADWSSARRRAVLLHELAHVARFDAATQLLGQLALAATWFNPLTWLAVRRMRVERERACDDVVLRRGTQASMYATDLLTIVLTLQMAGEPGFAALAMARHAELEGRLRFILDAHRRRAVPGPRRSALSIMAAAPFIVLVAAIHPSAHAAQHVVTAVARHVVSPAMPAIVPLVPRSLSAVGRAGHAFPAPPTTLPPTQNVTLDKAMGVSLPVTGPAQLTPARVQPVAGASTRCPVQTESARGGVSAEPGTVASLELENGDQRVMATASDGRCVTGRLDGWVIFSDDERDVTGLGTGAHVIVRDSVDGHVRAVLVSRVKAVPRTQGHAGVANKPVAAPSTENEPLYVIDGFIVNGVPLAANPHVDMSSGYPILVTSINPDDIERLKTTNYWILQKDNQAVVYMADGTTRPTRSDSIVTGSDSVGLESNSVGGVMAYQYFVDGEARSWREGAAWFRETLAELLRETGYDVQSRVAFLRNHGGVSAVLDEIRRVRSAAGLRSYFDALLASDNLSSDDVAQALSVAQSALTDKSDKDRIVARLKALAR